MKAFTFLSLIIAYLAFTTTETLTGKWESKSEKGNITGVIFKEDGSFEGYINKKPFVTAQYTYSSEDSILSFVDNGCNGARGIYKIHFYANADSMRFQLISDSCEERKQGMLRLNMGRVK